MNRHTLHDVKHLLGFLSPRQSFTSPAASFVMLRFVDGLSAEPAMRAPPGARATKGSRRPFALSSPTQVGLRPYAQDLALLAPQSAECCSDARLCSRPSDIVRVVAGDHVEAYTLLQAESRGELLRALPCDLLEVDRRGFPRT